MKIDVIYPVHERLEYTLMTLPLVVADCQQSIHDVTLWIVADNCKLETRAAMYDLLPIEPHFRIEVNVTKHGNSYDCTNLVLRQGKGKYIAKWDNDILIEPGATDILVRVMEQNKHIAFLGPTVEPIGHFWPENNNDTVVGIDYVEHIGGIGVFRRDAMKQQGPILGSVIEGEERYYGFTHYQHKSKMQRAWTDAVRVVELDKSTVYSRLEEYTEAGYGRNVIGYVESPMNKRYLSKETV